MKVLALILLAIVVSSGYLHMDLSTALGLQAGYFDIVVLVLVLVAMRVAFRISWQKVVPFSALYWIGTTLIGLWNSVPLDQSSTGLGAFFTITILAVISFVIWAVVVTATILLLHFATRKPARSEKAEKGSG